MLRVMKAVKSVKGILAMLVVSVFALGFARSAMAKTILDDYLSEMGVDIEVSATLDFYNKYVWRGMLLDGDPVIQPGFSIAAAGFEGGFWGSWDVDANDNLASDETDGYIGYSHDLGFINENLAIVSLSAGHTWYGFPELDSYAKEYYIGVSLDTLLSPTFTWYHDYSEEASGGADGDYYIFGISHSFTLNEEYGISLDFGEEVGFNNDYFITGDGGYTLTTLGFTIPIKGNLTMSPAIAYSVPFGDLEDDDGGNPQKEQFYAGVSLAFSF